MANAGPCITLGETKDEIVSKIAGYVLWFQADRSLTVELTSERLLVTSPSRGTIVNYRLSDAREVYGRLSHVGLLGSDMALVKAILHKGES